MAQKKRELRHPNVVTFMGVCVLQGSSVSYIVTEWMPGGDVYKLMISEQSKPVTWKSRISIAKDTATALNFLHQKGVIHRYAVLENQFDQYSRLSLTCVI